MNKPVLIRDLIQAILKDLKEHDMDEVFKQEWVDVTDAIGQPSIRSADLEVRIEDGDIIPHRLNGRIYCKKSELEFYFGTSDFSVRRRIKHD